MLAYLLWHRPQPDVAAQDYEARLIAFHEGLANAAPRGLLASATYRIDEVPWLRGRSGYEHWFFLDGCEALEALSQLAVSGAASPVHDGIAERSSLSHGGLYVSSPAKR